MPRTLPLQNSSPKAPGSKNDLLPAGAVRLDRPKKPAISGHKCYSAGAGGYCWMLHSLTPTFRHCYGSVAVMLRVSKAPQADYMATPSGDSKALTPQDGGHLYVAPITTTSGLDAAGG